MSANDSAPQLPNPNTPMAYLPPELAYQVTIAIYILVGSLGVMVWDILDNLRGDYWLLFNFPVRAPTIAYFVSRLASLGYALSSTIFETAKTGNCRSFQKGLDWLYPISVPATSLLFFFRVRAVFDRDRRVVGFFAFMWLAVLAGCLTVTQGVEGAEIGDTRFCVNASLESYVAAAAIIPLVNDTLIFLAITWRLMQNANVEPSLKGGVRTLFFGDYMPAFSKALLQDGQVYYLTTVSISLLTVIMLYVKSVPVTYQTMFTVPNIVLMNVMACRVFRNVKFGKFRETPLSSNRRDNDRSRHSGLPIPVSFASRARARNTEVLVTTVHETGLPAIHVHDAEMKDAQRHHDDDDDDDEDRPQVVH
ncbi:hypothetical protein NLJ89_g6892 [Agrocybe chaxingu]|uniref:Transmembrane protein n=1 Tax=Agrocybe chaxingu TaxID=84603 RepID=A0A9W8K4M9_9AGAR|nr:hypothetical protein NLJ89_g6892 [Agrocybe chaxingu]